MPTRDEIRSWMQRELQLSPDEYTDCGEVSATALAESALEHFDLWDEDTPGDDGHEAPVWDLAAELANDHAEAGR